MTDKRLVEIKLKLAEWKRSEENVKDSLRNALMAKLVAEVERLKKRNKILSN